MSRVQRRDNDFIWRNDVKKRLDGLEHFMIHPGPITGDFLGGDLRSPIVLPDVITAEHIASDTITASEIAANTITATEMTADSITAREIASDTITANEILSDTITSNEIAANAITVSELAANSVTTAKLNAFAVTAEKIATDTITAQQIASDTITANEIAAATITGAKIAGSTITAAKLNVAELSAITQNLGSINAGTIQGAIIQTAGSGSRVVMNSSGLRGYALDGVTETFEIDTGSGTAFFSGIADIKSGSTIVPGAIPAVGGYNLVSNSFFSAGPSGQLIGAAGSGWVGGGISEVTTVTSPLKYGPRTLRFSPSGVNSGVQVQVSNFAAWGSIVTNQNLSPVQTGKKYTGSGWFRLSPINARQSTNGRVRIMFYSDDGTNTDSQYSADVVLSSTEWRRITNTFEVPATTPETTRVRLLFYPDFVSGVIPAATELYYISGPQVEEGEVPTAFSPKPEEILPFSITDSMVNDLAAAKLTGQITSTQITDNAITTPKLNAGAVTAAKITANTITANEIAANAINTDELAANAVTAAKIAANTITASQIAASTITGTQMAAGTLTANHIQAGSITAQSLSFAQASRNMMRDAGFEFITGGAWENSTNAADGTQRTPRSGTRVRSTRVAGTTTNHSQFSSVAADNLLVEINKTYTISWYIRQAQGVANRSARSVIEYLNVSNGVVSTAGVSSVPLPASNSTWTRIIHTFTVPNDSTIVKVRVYIRYQTTDSTNMPNSTDEFDIDEFQFEPGEVATQWHYKVGDLQPGSVGNTVLGPDSVTTDKIFAGTILGTDIAADTITATNLAADSVTATEINVATLDAIAVSAGVITSGIFRGTIFETSDIDPKVRFDSSGVFTTKTATLKPIQLLPEDGLKFTIDVSDPSPDAITLTWNRSDDDSQIATIVGDASEFGGALRLRGGEFPGALITLQTFIGIDIIGISCGAVSRTLLDDSEQSSFLQLVNSGKWLVGEILTFDSGSLGPGGSTNVAAQNHGMPSGWTAAMFAVENVNNTSGWVINWTRISLTSTQVQYAALNISGGATGRSILTVVPIFKY